MSSTEVKKIPFMSEEPYDFHWDKTLKNKIKIYKFFLPLAHFLLGKEFTEVEFYGEENVPQEGAFILVSNHVNGFDPITLMTGIDGRRSCYFMAKKEFFQTFYIRGILELMGGFPVSRETADRNAMKFSKRVLDDGRFGLVIFPQGSRDRERKRPELDSTSNGYVMLARDSQAPVVPCSVHIGSDLTQKHVKCVVRYGKPISYEELGFTPGSKKKKELNAASETIWKKVQELWDKDAGM